MGNQYTAPIQYKTKDGLKISYIFYDLKGKNRFLQQPGDSEINFMFDRCLDQIDADPDQLQEIKNFNSKYKYRFTILHKRKVQEAKKNRELEELRRSSSVQIRHSHLKQYEQKRKTHELEEMIKEVEHNQTLIKVPLMKIDKYLTQNHARLQFIQIKGFERLLQLLEKAIKINNSGTKTNFSNQIELLKFFKLFSDRYPKEFYNHVPQIKNYASIVLRTYHPVNTHITAYCLSLLTDYFWRVQQCEHIITILQAFRIQQNYETFLSPFAETINQTDNILMAFYNIKFINELVASVIEEDKKELLKQSLNFAKYAYVLDGIKAKLSQNYFHLDNTTFISMHQKIFKYATKNRKNQKKITQESRVSFTNSLNLQLLHEQIMNKLIDNYNQSPQDDVEENYEQSIVAFLAESDRKSFIRFTLDTLTQLQKYNKFQFQLQNLSKNGDFLDKTQQIVQSKIYLTNIQNYLTRIKQACTKNNCNQIMTNCFKNLQYFEKIQWKHLERFILQELGMEKKSFDQIEELKKTLEDKENMIKRLIKQNTDLRNQLTQLRMRDGQFSDRNVGKLSQQSINFLQGNEGKMNQTMQQMNFSKKSSLNLPAPPIGMKGKVQLPKLPTELGKLPKSLDLLGSSAGIKQQGGKYEKPMRDKPKLNIQSKIINFTSKTQKKANDTIDLTLLTNNSLVGSIGLPNLPPPPSLASLNLPPPPSLGTSNLPPPSLNTLNLPPLPPALTSLNLPPPPPTLNLPPPPTLGSLNLPPPPTLNLPPPPTLGSLNLPPLPTLNLPPPPTLGSLNLPPPPTLGSEILPPPPTLGSLNLSPPPSLGNLNLPPPPSLGGNLIPPPLGQVSNLPMPGIINQTVQKLKEKRKPKVPLKICNYTILPYQKIEGSIFQQIDDTKLQWNQNQIEILFAKTIPPPSKQFSQEIKAKNSFAPTIKQAVKLLGPDRWRNAEIILTKLKISPGEVKRALTECSGKFSSHSNLQSILKLAPSEEQQQMIKTYQGNFDDLGKPQKFIKQLAEVPEYLSRIRAMIFSNIKEEFYYELSSKIQQLETGFKSLRQNKRLKHAVLICLGIGNYLNGTTLKGGAWGFKIQTMQRLEEIKSNDNKMNAAFYVIKQIWKEYPYPIFQKQQIDLYQNLSRIPVSQIQQQLGELKSYQRSIEKAFKSHNKNDPDDHIGPYCEEVMMELSVKVQQYKNSTQKLNQLYLDCAKYYCEDGKKLASDQFGKKMFQSILFISNTEKMFKIIQENRIKDQNRKASKNQLVYVEKSNPESIKKPEKKTTQINEIKKTEPAKILPNPGKILPDPVKLLPDPAKLLPDPAKLPPKIAGTGKNNLNKEEKLKQIQKIQQERQKKSLEEIMMRRTSKLQAYRMSKMSQVSTKKSIQEIDFLRDVK